MLTVCAISGIKRHIFVGILGLPHITLITMANILDRKRSIETIMCDCGYTGKSFADEVKSLIGATVEIAKRSELNIFKVIPKRWVIKRSFAWLEKCNRLWKNTERKLNTSLQFVNLAFLGL